MITKTDLQISNKSYTNLDFASIYPELLDLVKTLTNRWDPTVSNESDPGNVLLKLAAFIGDKTNYHIDKNTLEMFLPSATQNTSVRNIAQLNGYNPKYYLSATTDISFTFQGTVDQLPLSGDHYINFPKYTTTVKSEDGTIVYTLLDDCKLVQRNVTTVVPAIEGTMSILEIGNSNVITVDNLDYLRRVYFPYVNVAENGVFIGYATGNNPDEWTQVDLLTTQPARSLVYRFGFDSAKQLPYVQFPEDIASIIEDGLIIRYTLSSGLNGNITADTLKSLNNISSYTIYDSLDNSVVEEITDMLTLSITNLSSNSNGANPETIAEIYDNFQRTVGTFNTLISCRDYENYIFNLKDEVLDTNLVSNIFVGDRRKDFNYSTQFITYNDFGESREYNVSADITPFDLCLYPLQPLNVAMNFQAYVNSYKPNSSAEITQILEDDNYNELNSVKLLSHTYVDILDKDRIKSKNNGHGDIYLFKNYYKLNAVISTLDRVNSVAQQEIINNVKLALMQAFQSRNLRYGEEIPIEVITAIMTYADSRIKYVNLASPVVESWVMYADGFEEKLVDNQNISDAYYQLLAKNILLGKISLFDYNEEFEYDFGYTLSHNAEDNNNSPIYESISSIGSELTLALDNNNLSHTLRENEQIQFFGPSLATEVTYPVYVNYCWEPDMAGTAAKPFRLPLSATNDLQSAINTYINTYWATPLAGLTDTSEIKVGDNYKYYIISEHVDYAKAGRYVDSDGVVYAECTDTSFSQHGEDTFTYTVYNESGDATLVSKPLGYYVFLNADGADQDGNPILDNVTSDNLVQVGSFTNSQIIHKDEEHLLVGSEKLYLNYLDSSNITHNILYTSSTITEDGTSIYVGANNIIKPNFEMIRTISPDIDSDVASVSRNTVYKNGRYYNTLTANETIEKRQIVQTSINSSQFNCYWITNNIEEDTTSTKKYCKLFDVGDTVKVLDVGEYFIYTNSDFTSLSIFGTGTIISLQDPVKESEKELWMIPTDEAIDIESIVSDGITGIGQANWKTINCSQNMLTIADSNIITLGEGNTINFENVSLTSFGTSTPTPKTELDNDLAIIVDSNTSTISYIIDGVTTILPRYSIGTNADINQWKVRTRLNINSGPDNSQAVLPNQAYYLWKYDAENGGEAAEPIVITHDPNDTALEKDTRLEFNTLIQKNGVYKSQVSGLYLFSKLLAVQTVDALVYDKEKVTYIQKIVNPDESVTYSAGTEILRLADGFDRVSTSRLQYILNGKPNDTVTFTIGTSLLDDDFPVLDGYVFDYWEPIKDTSGNISFTAHYNSDLTSEPRFLLQDSYDGFEIDTSTENQIKLISTIENSFNTIEVNLNGGSIFSINSFVDITNENNYSLLTSGSIYSYANVNNGVSDDQVSVSDQIARSIKLPILSIPNTVGLFMVYLRRTEKDQQYSNYILRSVDANDLPTVAIKKYNSLNSLSTTIALTEGINVIEVDTAVCNRIVLSKFIDTGAPIGAPDFIEKEQSIILIGKYKQARGINNSMFFENETSYIDINDTNNKLLTYIRNGGTVNNIDKFNYVTDINNDLNIDASSMYAPEALWDINNVGNKITIAEIDFGQHTAEFELTGKMPQECDTKIIIANTSKARE